MERKIIGQTTLLIFLVFFMLLAPASAELLKVEQEIYGMDCAPCAYGMEKSLKKMDGVKKVKVSLNKGTAIIDLKPGNEVTIEQIKEIVRRNGFTPKETRILEGKPLNASMK